MLRIRDHAAAIFDVDGVLVDSEPLHAVVVREILSHEGHRLTDGEYAELIGRDQPSAWEWLRSRFGLRSPVATYAAEYESALVERLTASVSEPLPCARELLERLRDDGVALAAASSSPRAVVAATLRGLGLLDTFRVVVAGNEVRRGKPDPEIFLTAARLLMVEPRSCVVIEDSVHGIGSGRAAGMRVIGVRTRYTGAAELPADLVVGSLCELLEAEP